MATQTYKRRHLNNLKRPQQEANMADKLSQTPTEEELEPARITIHLHQLQPADKLSQTPTEEAPETYALARMPLRNRNTELTCVWTHISSTSRQ